MLNRISAAALLVVATLSGCASLYSPCPQEALSTLLASELPAAYKSSVPPLARTELGLAVHQRVNDVRAEHGLRPLSWEPELAVVAVRHSEDMATRSFFSHVNPDGDDPTERARRLGLEYERIEGDRVVSGVGENLFLGHRFSEYRTHKTPDGDIRCEFDWLTVDDLAKRVVDDWSRSETHRANLLSSVYRGHAIGVAEGPNGTVFLTQNLSPAPAGSRAIALNSGGI